MNAQLHTKCPSSQESMQLKKRQKQTTVQQAPHWNFTEKHDNTF